MLLTAFVASQENGGGEAAIQSAILRAQERALAAELAEAPPQPAGPRRGRRAVVETDSDSQVLPNFCCKHRCSRHCVCQSGRRLREQQHRPMKVLPLAGMGSTSQSNSLRTKAYPRGIKC